VVLIILQSVNDNQYLTRKEVVRRCRGRRWLFMETNPKVVNLYSAGLKSLASCVKNKKCVYEYKAYVWGSRPLGGGRCSLVASAERLWLSWWGWIGLQGQLRCWTTRVQVCLQHVQSTNDESQARKQRRPMGQRPRSKEEKQHEAIYQPSTGNRCWMWGSTCMLGSPALLSLNSSFHNVGL